jgi:hypothetical protein
MERGCEVVCACVGGWGCRGFEDGGGVMVVVVVSGSRGQCCPVVVQ